MQGRVETKNVFKVAGAFIAFLIGAGFATGQEVFQYFTAWGMKGLLVGLATFIGLGYAGSDFIAVGYKVPFSNTNDIYRYYAGRWIGGFYDYFSTIFNYMSYIVMLAGTGATVSQHWGVSPLIGGLVIAVISAGTVLLGLRRLADIIGCIGPVIVLFALGVGAFALFDGGIGVKDGAAMLEDPTFVGQITRVGGNWFAASASYVGFCMLWLAAFLAAMGRQSNSVKEGVSGTISGALGFSIGAVVLMLGFLAHMNEVAFADIPSLILAKEIWAPIASVFALVIMAGIFTTSVPLLWSVSARYSQEGTNKFRILTIALAALALFVAFSLPFKQVVNIIYGINGYVGALLLVIMITKRLGINDAVGRMLKIEPWKAPEE